LASYSEEGSGSQGDATIVRLAASGNEETNGRPYGIRTHDTLIKRYRRYVPEGEKK